LIAAVKETGEHGRYGIPISSPPDAGEVGLTVGRSRRRRVEPWASLRVPRDASYFMLRPLRRD
jgi:hypothetical protein